MATQIKKTEDINSGTTSWFEWEKNYVLSNQQNVLSAQQKEMGTVSYLLTNFLNLDVQNDLIRLTSIWHKERENMSNPRDIFSCPAYLAMLNDFTTEETKDCFLNFILKDLEEKKSAPDNWFHALRKVTNENPVPADHNGNRVLMAQDWLLWARNNGRI